MMFEEWVRGKWPWRQWEQNRTLNKEKGVLGLVGTGVYNNNRYTNYLLDSHARSQKHSCVLYLQAMPLCVVCHSSQTLLSRGHRWKEYIINTRVSFCASKGNNLRKKQQENHKVKEMKKKKRKKTLVKLWTEAHQIECGEWKRRRI